jgi:peptide/nickel transport system substrate-binding protein
MRPRLLTPLCLAVSALLLGACSTPGSGTTTGASDDTLVISTPTEPDSLDPTMANTFAARLVFASFCEKLYDVDSHLRIVPQLAAALPKVSADGKVLDIPIRKGVTFNDGTPLDAAAVKKTLDRDRTLKGSMRVNEISSISRVEVPDPMDVRLVLKHPSAPLVSQLADRSGLVMSPKALDALGANFGNAPVCVGPFQFKQRVSGNEVDFVKSTHYYDADKVKLKGVIYKFINNSSVATANLESGDIEAAEHLDPSDAVKLDSESGYSVLRSNTIAYQSVEFNLRPDAGTALSKSPELRKAFEMSIDRKILNKAVWNNQEAVDCQPLPIQSPLHSDLPCTPYDPEAAKRIIKQSGIHTPIPVELMVPTGSGSQREGQVIQSMADDVGFKVSVKPIDLVSALDLARTGKFDAFLEGWSGRVDPDGDTNDIITTGGSNNFSGVGDKAVDSFVGRAAATNDTAERRKLYAGAVKEVASKRPLIYLYHDRWFIGVNNHVHGVVYPPDGIPRFKTAYISH